MEREISLRERTLVLCCHGSRCQRKPPSTVVEMKDCDGLRGIDGPGRGDAGGLQPPPFGTCLPDQNGCCFRGRLIPVTPGRLVAQIRFKVMHYTLIKAEFVLPHCGFIPSENHKMEEAVKTVFNVPTFVHSKEVTTGKYTWYLHKCFSISFQNVWFINMFGNFTYVRAYLKKTLLLNHPYPKGLSRLWDAKTLQAIKLLKVNFSWHHHPEEWWAGLTMSNSFIASCTFSASKMLKDSNKDTTFCSVPASITLFTAYAPSVRGMCAFLALPKKWAGGRTARVRKFTPDTERQTLLRINCFLFWPFLWSLLST